MKDINFNRTGRILPCRNFREISTCWLLTAVCILCWLSLVLQPVACAKNQMSLGRNSISFIESSWNPSIANKAYEYDETNVPAAVSDYRQSDIQLGAEIFALQLGINTYVRNCSIVEAGHRGSEMQRWKNFMKNYLRNFEVNLLVFLLFTMTVKTIVIACIAYSWRSSKAITTGKSDDCIIEVKNDFSTSSRHNMESTSSRHNRERIHIDCTTDLQPADNLPDRDQKISSKLQNDIVVEPRIGESLLDCGEKILSDHFEDVCKAAHTVAESFVGKTIPRPWIQAARRGSKKQRRRCMVFVEDTSSYAAFQSGLHMY